MAFPDTLRKKSFYCNEISSSHPFPFSGDQKWHKRERKNVSIATFWASAC